MHKADYKLVSRKSFWFAMAVFAVAAYFYFSFLSNTYTEYHLLKSGKIADGVVTNCEKKVDETEHRQQIISTYCSYKFKDENGQSYESISDIFDDSLVVNYPHPVKVKYFETNPQTSTIQIDLSAGWYTDKLINGFLGFCIVFAPLIYILYLVLKKE